MPASTARPHSHVTSNFTFIVCVVRYLQSCFYVYLHLVLFINDTGQYQCDTLMYGSHALIPLSYTSYTQLSMVHQSFAMCHHCGDTYNPGNSSFCPFLVDTPVKDAAVDCHRRSTAVFVTSISFGIRRFQCQS